MRKSWGHGQAGCAVWFNHNKRHVTGNITRYECVSDASPLLAYVIETLCKGSAPKKYPFAGIDTTSLIFMHVNKIKHLHRSTLSNSC